jgi:hypothetical protein
MSSIIRIKDRGADAMIEIDYSDIKRVTIVSVILMEIERRDGTITQYEFGLDGQRRMGNWLRANGALQTHTVFDTQAPQKVPHPHDLDWYAQTLGTTVEQIRRDLGLAPTDDGGTVHEFLNRRAHGRAALADLISHGDNLLSAVDARIECAKVEDTTNRDLPDAASEPRDPNESYWKREREVVRRMIAQAKYALCGAAPAPKGDAQ